ncbi:class I SAM-dependent methyltransferase [Ottowia thiooxydans]|uniref:class I SAM-dependent methyltransferase n=1 Tax=Ottowia thiooxydans TaxID=219182 RepID=UPI00146B96D2|nr:class I SAM-dependent methyltransferase [Ottowia thiooxydans]
MNIHQRLWESACGIEDELAWRQAMPAQPEAALEMKFNGGVAPAVANHYSKIVTSGRLPEAAKILDLGCGFGRIAMALANRIGPAAQYVGLDPNVEGLAWAQRHIATRHPNFSFRRVDIKSLPYNPTGTVNGSEFRFPFEDASLDLVFMISVLTHVDLATVENYVREAARTLKADTGRLVTTIFLLDDEVDDLLAEGKGHFTMGFGYGESRVENPANPELAIAHPRQAVLDILDRAGFAHHTVFTGHWSGRDSISPLDFQDLVIADRSPGAVHSTASSIIPPVEDVSPGVQQLYDRITELTNGDEGQFGQFISWSNTLAFNALWWQHDGLTLALADDTSTEADRWHLRFHTWSQLGLENIRPDDSAPRGAFHTLDDIGMVTLLIRTERAVLRHTLLSSLQEAAANGLLVLEAIRAGKKLVLRSPDCPPLPAPIPAFEA